MKVATIQLGIVPGEDREQTFLRVEEMLSALPAEVDLVLLPELWNVGFFSFDRYPEVAEPLHGKTVERLARAAKKLDAYIFTGSFVERQEDRFYNTCALLDRKGDMVANYQKMHLFGYGSRECEVMSAGEAPVVAQTDFGKVGLSICYDLRFPELYRKLVDQGAQVLINCAAWPYPRVENWSCLNMVRAMENQSYFLSCSCADGAPGQQFIGRSMVVDPWGTPIAAAGERETIILSDIYPERVPAIRKEFTALQDRIFHVADLPAK